MRKRNDDSESFDAKERLLALLENPSKLSKDELKRFTNIFERAEAGTLISKRQGEWIEDVFRRLGLKESFEPQNLVSNGKVVLPEDDARSRAALEAALGPKPCKPPPSSRRNYA